MNRLAFAILGMWLSASGPLWAACAPAPGDIARVQTLGDGGLVRLADGREVKLAGLLLPGTDGSRGADALALTEQASAALAARVSGRRVQLFYGATREDRYGRVLAHLVVLPMLVPGAGNAAAEIFTATQSAGLPGEPEAEAFWLQGALLREGWARAYSLADDPLCAGTMRALEKQARDVARGLWAVAAYRIRDASDLEALRALKGSFQIVEGRLLEVTEKRGTVFFNFGPDWRHDFTVTAKKATVRRLVRAFSDKAGISLDGVAWPAQLNVVKGQRVRVRGWIGDYHGPEIILTHSEQIEFFDVAKNETERDG